MMAVQHGQMSIGQALVNLANTEIVPFGADWGKPETEFLRFQ
jgi:hypothetical protein